MFLVDIGKRGKTFLGGPKGVRLSTHQSYLSLLSEEVRKFNYIWPELVRGKQILGGTKGVQRR